MIIGAMAPTTGSQPSLDAIRDLRLRRERWAPPCPGDAVRAAIAIPVRDEERRLPACLEAFAAQRDPNGQRIAADRFEIVLLLNNCRDASFEVATGAVLALPLRVSVIEVELPPAAAHVGWARRLACDAAAATLEGSGEASGLEGGVVLSTDADSTVRPGWLAAATRAIEGGADAVAGAITPHPEDLGALNPHARTRLLHEHRYGRLLDRLATLVDPEPHDPWPRHSFHCGASMAVRRTVYRAVGGLPPVPVSEDQAFFAELTRRDYRIRHCPEVAVRTSCRTVGRAAGGMADALSRWSRPSQEASDEIDSVAGALATFRLRAGLRHAYRKGGVPAPGLAERLRLPPVEVEGLLARPTFGLALEAAALRSPAFRGRRVPATRLAAEIAVAERVIARLEARAGDQARRARSSR